MEFADALAAEIGRCREREADENVRTDAYDSDYLAYLEDVQLRLGEGAAVGAVRAWLAEDLPRLEQESDDAAFERRFDWYDDHYYEKKALGRLRACRFALGLPASGPEGSPDGA